jgi:transposase
MRQIIRNLGFTRITCRPQSKRRNQALINEFIAEIKKRILKKDIGRKIFLLMDRAPWHKSKKAGEFFQRNKYWLQTLLFLPATPDRNPAEYCWKITREDLTSIKSFKNLKVLKEELDEYWGKHSFTHKMSHYLKW